MIDVNKQVRTAIVSLLDGAVTVDGVPVPVYHEQNPDESGRIYIILNQQTDEDNSNKDRFVTNGTILVDVVHLTDGVTYDVVDDVAGEIMNLLQPTPKTHGLTDPDGLQIHSLQKMSSNPLPFTSDQGNVMRRVLRYEYKVVEI